MFDVATFLPGEAPRVLRGAAQEGFHSAKWSGAPCTPVPRSARGSRLVGLKYERRVLDVLSAIYGERFTASPVIEYSRVGEARSARRAIPDGILRLDGPLGPSVFIIEVKLAHTADVWPQLMDTYVPLIAMIEPKARLRPVEVCRTYDPAVMLPGPHELIESLHVRERSSQRHSKDSLALEVLQWKI